MIKKTLKKWRILFILSLLCSCEEQTAEFTTGGKVLNNICSKEFSVDFRFILDTTTSMQAIFPVIQSNAERFSEEIAQSISDDNSRANFRFGLSTFNESNNPRHLAYKDLDSFIEDVNQLNVVEVTSNLDFPENGIQAMETLLEKDLNTDHLQIVFFVSDNLAHRGGTNFERDFSMNTILNNIEMFSQGNPLLLFDSTPFTNDNDPFYSIPNPVTNKVQSLPTYAENPAEQWDYVRSQSGNKIIGQSFGFPLDSTTLNERVPIYLAQYKKDICQ